MLHKAGEWEGSLMRSMNMVFTDLGHEDLLSEPASSPASLAFCLRSLSASSAIVLVSLAVSAQPRHSLIISFVTSTLNRRDNATIMCNPVPKQELEGGSLYVSKPK